MDIRERHDSLDVGSTTWRGAASNVSQIVKRTFVVCYVTLMLFSLPLAILGWAILRAAPSLFPRPHFQGSATEAARINTVTGLVILVIAVLLLLLPFAIRLADRRLEELTRRYVTGQNVLLRLVHGQLHDLPDETLTLGVTMSVLDWPQPASYLTPQGDKLWRVGNNLDAYLGWSEGLKRFGWKAYQGMKYLTLPLWPVGLYCIHLTNWYKLSTPLWIAALVIGALLLAVPLTIGVALRRKQVWLKTLTEMIAEAYQRSGTAR